MVKILSIGGSDCIAGAGIQADIKTAVNLSAYCATVVTCVTVQNSRGVKRVNPVGLNVVIDQLNAVFEDFLPDAIKIGMLPDISIVNSVRKYLTPYSDKIKIVLDPILAPTKGRLMDDCDKKEFYKAVERLSEICFLATPNHPESKLLPSLRSKYKIEKGGHGLDDTNCIDRQYRRITGHNGEISWQLITEDELPRVETSNTHGTGCVYSTALAVNIAEGIDIALAMHNAHEFITEALRKGKSETFGAGYGPTLFF